LSGFQRGFDAPFTKAGMGDSVAQWTTQEVTEFDSSQVGNTLRVAAVRTMVSQTVFQKRSLFILL